MTSSMRRIQTLLGRAGMARSRDLVAAGMTRSGLSRMVATGDLVRLARGLYARPGYKSSEHGVLAEVAKRAPNTLFCLLTALREARRSKKASADELWRYAQIDRVANVLRPYLEAVA